MCLMRFNHWDFFVLYQVFPWCDMIYIFYILSYFCITFLKSLLLDCNSYRKNPINIYLYIQTWKELYETWHTNLYIVSFHSEMVSLNCCFKSKSALMFVLVLCIFVLKCISKKWVLCMWRQNQTMAPGGLVHIRMYHGTNLNTFGICPGFVSEDTTK